jgi:hypothetical protein
MEGEDLMKRYQKTFTLIAACVAGSLNAQSTAPDAEQISPANPLITVGLPLNGDITGSYIVLSSGSARDFAGEVLHVYRKSGAASSASSYAFVGQMRSFTDARGVATALDRANSLLGDQTPEMTSAVEALLQAMEIADDSSFTTLPEMLATLIDMAQFDAELWENLRMLGKRFPGIALASGFAYMEDADGEYTYELRWGADPMDPAAADLVVGRVTLDTAVAVSLPAPTDLVALPASDARGDRAVRLRWASPDALRALGPKYFGYQLYRVPESVYDDQGYSSSPPVAADIAAYAVNDNPILPDEEMDALEAGVGAGSDLDTAMQNRFSYPAAWKSFAVSAAGTFPANLDTARTARIAAQIALNAELAKFHYIDDGGEAVTGVGFEGGELYYYYVAARDLLGSSGALSDALKVVVPTLQPVSAPENVRIDNRYEFYGLGAPEDKENERLQQLELTWEPLRDDAGNPRSDVEYFVYRWTVAAQSTRYAEYPFDNGGTIFDDPSYDALSFFGLDSNGDPNAEIPIGVAAGPDDLSSAYDSTAGRYRWVDPLITKDYQSRAFYYTVRAVTDSGNGFPVFSPPSAPVRGVLRDREGPDAASDIRVVIPCVEITLDCDDTDVDPNPNDSRTSIVRDGENVLLRTRVTTAQIGYFDRADFYYKPAGADATKYYLGSAPFERGVARIARMISYSDSTSGVVYCRAWLKNGVPSEEFACPLTNENKGDVEKGFVATLNLSWPRVPSDACGEVFFPVDPDGVITFPQLEVFPAEDTYGYRVYRSVDGGALELLGTGEQDSQTGAYDTGVAIVESDTNLPAHAERICYYYQGFDQHGNPGPRQRISCLQMGNNVLELPIPEITRVRRTDSSTEAQPGIDLSWFCPPEGVDRFDILVREAGGALPDDLDDFVVSNPSEQPDHMEREPFVYRDDDGVDWRVYRTARPVQIEETEDEEGLYAISIGGIEAGYDYVFRVRARGAGFEFEDQIDAMRGEPSDPATISWVGAYDAPTGVSPDVPWPARGIRAARPVGTTDPDAVISTGQIQPAFLEINTGTSSPQPVYTGAAVEIGQFIVTAPNPSYESIPLESDREKNRSSWIANIVVADAINWSDTAFHTLIGVKNADGDDRACLPGVLYRMTVDGTGAPLTGDLVQCGPLMGVDAATPGVFDPNSLAISVSGGSLIFRDPFLVLGNGEPIGSSGSYRIPLYVKDTQPVIEGYSYRYLLALYQEDGELQTVLDLGVLEIPVIP